MDKIDQTRIAIEQLRRRAKDNKSNNVRDFVLLSESYLDKTRNTIFLVTLAIIGFAGAVQKNYSPGEIAVITLSMISGLVSIIFSHKYALANARYYSDLECNLSSSFPSVDEYNLMIENEKNIQKEHCNRHTNQLISIGAIGFQLLFTTVALVSILAK